MKTNFFEKVYEVVKKIPEGKVTSYGAIASYLGSPRSARMVGWALNKSNNSYPAHRWSTNKAFDGQVSFVKVTNATTLENEGIEVKIIK